jgi:PAS domain S-box-containing protein
MKFPFYREILAVGQLPKKFSKFGDYLIVAGAIGLSIFLWSQAQAVDFERHNRYVANLRLIQEMDARINVSILQARDGMLTYYDPIVNDLAEVKALQVDLKLIPNFVDRTGREELDQLLQSYIKLWQDKEHRIQRFQSHNGVLRNSLVYFPIALANLIGNKINEPTLANNSNELLRHILLFNLTHEAEIVPQIDRKIQQLLGAKYLDNDRKTLEMAISHARIILNRSSIVNDLVKSIVILPTSKQGDDIAQAYNRYYQKALDRTHTYRLYLYLLSIILLIGIAAAIIRRLRTYALTAQEAEEKYRNIFENSVAGIFQTTPDGQYLSANPMLGKIYGYGSNLELIQHLTDIQHQLYVLPSRRREFVDLMQEKGAAVDFESQVYRQDGSIIWISENARSVCDRTGEFLYYEGSVTDITARKQAEIALQDSEAELRLLFAAMTDIVIIFDADGRYLKSIGTQLRDYKPGVNPIGKTVREILPTELAELFINRIQQALLLRRYASPRESQTSTHDNNLDESSSNTASEPHSVNVEYSLPIHGQKNCFSASVSPLSENTVLWVARNISDRKQLEDELQQSEKQMRALLDAIPDRMFRHRIDGTYLDFQVKPEDLLFPREALIGRKLSDLTIPEAIVQGLLGRFQLAVESGELQTYEHEMTTPDGTHYFEARIMKSGVDEVVCIVRDITDRRQAETALKEAMQAAEVANQAKSQFLSNMSHELRTPLNVILGFTQLLARSSSLTPKQQGHLDAIVRSGEHLLKLINDVLEISKIEAGKITLNEDSFDLYALLDWLQEMLRLKAESKGLKLIFDLAPSLPRYIRTDESKLSQILMNLLSNAIKFTQVGSAILRVYSSHPFTLHFEIEDSGPGIASTELDNLFEPFVQTEVGISSREGTGLGLPISKKFVHLMGGEIEVESRLGEGTIFKFDIHASQIEVDRIQIRKPHRQVIGLEIGQPHYRILIAEDKLENRQLLVEMLAPVGFEVREACNGQEALSLWQTWAPHLIWMDMQMPVMNGYEATRQIKAAIGQSDSDRTTVVIALTGSAFEKDRVEALAVGCDDFVRKPFRVETIFEKMTEHLGVRYLYGSWQLASNTIDTSPETQPPLHPTALREALAVMPIDWVEELHQAAKRVHAKQILKSIAQIPPTNVQLANSLTHLANNFCFEEIVSLTQQQ